MCLPQPCLPICPLTSHPRSISSVSTPKLEAEHPQVISSHPQATCLSPPLRPFPLTNKSNLPTSGSVGEESACNAGDRGRGSGRSLGGKNGNPLQYSCLENSLDRGSWWATVHGSQRTYSTEPPNQPQQECVGPVTKAFCSSDVPRSSSFP